MSGRTGQTAPAPVVSRTTVQSRHVGCRVLHGACAVARWDDGGIRVGPQQAKDSSISGCSERRREAHPPDHRRERRSEPDFSPDGSFIAFRSDRAGGGIYVMPALGGNARLVAEGGRRPAVLARRQPHRVLDRPVALGCGARGLGAVFIGPANGGQPTRVADGFPAARDPVWSPDGKSLLFFGRKVADDSPSGTFDWCGRRRRPRTGPDRRLSGDDRAGDHPTARRLISSWRDQEPAAKEAGRRRACSSPLFSAKASACGGWECRRIRVRPPIASLERLTSGAGFDLAASADDSGRMAFQSSSEGYVSLTLPLDANAGRPTGPIVDRRSGPAAAAGTAWTTPAACSRIRRAERTKPRLWVKDLRTGQERHLVTTRLGESQPGDRSRWLTRRLQCCRGFTRRRPCGADCGRHDAAGLRVHAAGVVLRQPANPRARRDGTRSQRIRVIDVVDRTRRTSDACDVFGRPGGHLSRWPLARVRFAASLWCRPPRPSAYEREWATS